MTPSQIYGDAPTAATVSSPPPPQPSSLERTSAETKTKPGVIRPAIAVPRLRVDDYAGEYQCNPFNRHPLDAPAARSPAPASHSARTPRQDEARLGVTASEEDGPPTSTLFIMESEDLRPRSVKPAAWHGASTTFSCAKVLPDVSETRI
ncbi:hypothetical protein CRUP_030813 [Coryphaenoides rupestris]|nr:hypothetical protein CRUP_030813 [Coryphaenoides rupestris]